MQAYLRLSTHTLTATLTNSAGAGVTGATVTAVVYDTLGNGVRLTTGAAPGDLLGTLTLTDAGAGAYTATVPATLNVVRGAQLFAEVTAIKTTVQRFARVPIEVQDDDT